MWIVRVALDRPYTFIIPALLILLLSPVVILLPISSSKGSGQ
jgi:hypothetical protein